MATDAIETPAKTASSGVTLYRFTVEQYLSMIDAGVFVDGPDAELLGGRIVSKMTKNEPHDFGVDQFSELIRACLPAEWIVRQEKSIVLSRWSRPEPDIVVARGPRSLYKRRAPGPPDLALVIEVADSS